MSELKTAIDIIGIIFELFFSSAFFDYIFNKTFKSKKNFFSLLYVLILCTGVFIPQIKNFAPIISLLATFVLSLSYNSKIISKMIYSTMLFLSFIMSEMVIGLVMSSILRLPVEKIIDNLYFYACGVLFSKFIIYIILKLIIEIKNKDVNTSLLSRISKFFILPISTLYTVLIIFYLSYKTDSFIVTISTVIAVVLLILANIFTIYFIDKILSSEMKIQKLKATENMLKLQSIRYKEIISTQKEISKIKHDMNNYLISLSGYILSGNTETALNKINEKVLTIAEHNYYKCNNYCLETLINSKFKAISQQNIIFDFKTNIPEKINVDETDLCIIVGNLLDNAREACEKIDKLENKRIKLYILVKGNYISIYQSNTISKMHQPNKDFSTQKNNKLYHGFGIENIKQIVKKYNGTSDFKFNDSEFNSCLLLKNS